MDILLECQRRPVIMFVNDIRGSSSNAGRRDNLEIRICSFDCIVKLSKSAIVTSGSIEEILVSDFHVFQGKWCRVTISGAFCAPSGGCVTCYILNFIEGIVNIGNQISTRIDVSAVERIAGVDGEKRFHVDVFAPFQELQKSQAVIGAVTPRAKMAGPLLNRAQGVLPLESIRNCISFEVISSRHPQKRWFDRSQFFHQIGTVSIWPIFESRRKD